MRKTEIKNAPVNALIVDYVQTQSRLTLSYNLGGGTVRDEKHSKDLEAELVKRGLLTEEDVRRLNF